MWRPAKTEGGLIVVVVLVVAAFVATSSFVLFRSRAIGEAANAITTNAVPSIQQLISARAEVAALRVRLERHVTEASPDEGSGGRVWRTVGELRSRISAYVALPSYPGEQERWDQLLATADALVDSVGDVTAAANEGDRAKASALLEETFAPLSENLERLISESERLNAEQVQAFAVNMEAHREETRRAAILLNVLCIAMAAILLVWALRNARDHRLFQERYVRESQQRAEEMEVFAGRVAHDILSPLGSVSLALETLAKSEDGRVTSIVRKGLNGIARVRTTVDGLLEFAKAGANPPQEVSTDVVEVARDAVSGLQEHAEATNVSLDFLAAGTSLPVRANPGVVTSIVTNLVQNAIKYMGEATERHVSVQVCEREDRARVEVRDTGPGMPPDIEQRVFEPYFRVAGLSVSGLGLGLATVKRLVEAHHGRIGVESGPGRGSIFWFELPVLS